MVTWAKGEIELQGGARALAQMPVIVSASRSTDIPAFYSDWFMERLRAGYIKWFNPFNGVPLYVGFRKMRCMVFWSKNPKPMLAHLDEMDKICPSYYFQFTLNDYDTERIEPNVPSVSERVETFRRLSDRLGRDRVVWRFDPLILTEGLTVKALLEKVERLGDKLAPLTSRLVFSFIDIKSYAKVGKNLERGGISAREFSSDEMCEVAQRIGELVKVWGIAAGTCGEITDLDRYGIEHNRCIDDRLMVKCFSHDRELMDFIGYDPQGELFDLRTDAERESDEQRRHARLKDKGQRLACGCIISKDIGEYNTCPHLCRYCYANANNAAAMENWKRHCASPHAETITEDTDVSTVHVVKGNILKDQIGVQQVSFSVTFDSNVIETILDSKKRIGDAEKLIFCALQRGTIQGFVARSYFSHDAIKRDCRVNALCDNVEFRIPANPVLYRKGVGLKVVRTSRVRLNEHNQNVIDLLRELNMEVLDFKRNLWPDVGEWLPIKQIPVDYNGRVRKIQEIIEKELLCGFYRFRSYLRQEIGGDGDDLGLLQRLKEREYSKGAFNAAFAEAADGDALIAHYGYGIDYFCTDDRASKAGAQSVFSQSNRSLLRERLGIRIVCPAELANIIEGALYGR